MRNNLLFRHRAGIIYLMCTILFTANSWAADFSVDGLCYDIISANTVQVVKPTSGKYTGDITILERVIYDEQTYKVVAIGDNAFQGANQVTSVTLPLTGITSIGGWAFNDCTGLTSFTLPASVTSIGEKAFYFCDNLHDLYVCATDPAAYNPGYMAFSKIHYGSHKCTLHVPTGCTAAYAADPTFSVFTQVEEFDPPQVYDLYVAGTQVTSLNASDILGDGVASYEASSNTLTISGNITAPDNNTPCIDNGINNLTINVVSAVTLTAYDKTINIQSTTTLTGSAQLTVTATKIPDPHDYVDTNYAIYTAGNYLNISNANLLVTGEIGCYGNLNISNANLRVTGSIGCSGNLNITNSTLSVDYTFFGGENMNVTNSTVSITNGSIMGFKSFTLTDCYLKTPQGGYYDSSSKRLVDAKGTPTYPVEIRPGAGPTLYELYVAGTRVTSENASGILGDGVASYDASSNTLTISGNITAPDNNTPCIDNGINNLTINVVSAVTLTAYDKTINIQSTTTLTGSAQLTVTATKIPDPHDYVDTNYAIYTAGNYLNISNANLLVTGEIGCYGNLNISNANLRVTGSIGCSGNLNITNSTLSVDYTFFGGENMNVTNSTVSITNGSIMGFKSFTLTDCYLKTPQGGYYDSSSRRLVDADGKYSSIVEIVPIEDPIGIEEILVNPSDDTRKVLHDGKLYIIRADGKVFNAQGARVN